MQKTDFLIQSVRQILALRAHQEITDDGKGLKHAGVLIPLLQEQDVWKVLFTRRSRQVEHHKGQISFPGGTVDIKDDAYEDTALRESFEEIGLLKEQVEILGRIDDIQTVASRFLIHPFVGHVFEYNRFNMNAFEVDSIIKIPLKLFFKAGSYDGQCSIVYEEKSYETPAYRCHEDLIWGATAGMMKNFVDIMGDKIGLLQGKK